MSSIYFHSYGMTTCRLHLPVNVDHCSNLCSYRMKYGALLGDTRYWTTAWANYQYVQRGASGIVVFYRVSVTCNPISLLLQVDRVRRLIHLYTYIYTQSQCRWTAYGDSKQPDGVSGLWDPTEGLFFRDATYFNKSTPSGKKVRRLSCSSARPTYFNYEHALFHFINALEVV